MIYRQHVPPLKTHSVCSIVRELVLEEGKDGLEISHPVLALERFFICPRLWRHLDLHLVRAQSGRFPGTGSHDIGDGFAYHLTDPGGVHKAQCVALRDPQTVRGYRIPARFP